MTGDTHRVSFQNLSGDVVLMDVCLYGDDVCR